MVSVLGVLILSFAGQHAAATPIEDQTYASLMEQARVEYLSGRYAQAEAVFLSALRALAPVDKALRARTLSSLGAVYVNQDQLPKAEHVYGESLALYKHLGDNIRVAATLTDLGAVYSLQRRDHDALRLLEEALKIVKASAPPDPASISQILNRVGIVYYRQGKMNKAEKIFNEALQIAPDYANLYRRADLLNNLGAIYHRKRQFEKAEQYFKSALKISEDEVGRMHPDLTFSLSSLAALYTDTGRYAEAEEQYQRALSILEPADSNFETRIARLLHGLSRMYSAAGRKSDAESALVRAAAIARRKVAEHSDMVLILDEFAERLRTSGKVKEAEELRGVAKRARVAAALVVSGRRPSPF